MRVRTNWLETALLVGFGIVLAAAVRGLASWTPGWAIFILYTLSVAWITLFKEVCDRWRTGR